MPKTAEQALAHIQKLKNKEAEATDPEKKAKLLEQRLTYEADNSILILVGRRAGDSPNGDHPLSLVRNNGRATRPSHQD